MTTKRKVSKSTSRLGINFVRDIVEQKNCIFQEIDLENDVGNDAYVEFIKDENSTGCCIAVQIKSGNSFISSSGDKFFLKADKDHFEYWNSHLLPVGAIVYDPKSKTAVWCDVTGYLKENPKIVENGPYNIPISKDQKFCLEKFSEFSEKFLSYQEIYSKDSNFGEALEQFADLSNLEECNDGLRALFSFHRQKFASWYYLLNSFKNFRNHPLLSVLVIILCHIPGHMDIWWHKENIIDSETRKKVLETIKIFFDREDIVSMLSVVDEELFSRGSIGQCVWAIIDVVENKKLFLESIAFDTSLEENIRYYALLLSIYEKQNDSDKVCLNYIKNFVNKFPYFTFNSELEYIYQQINKYKWIDFF